MIVLKGISKKYGQTLAVDGINLSINQGEVVGLLGPNGAGKSTTLKLISGFLVADSGTIFFDEKEILSTDTDFRKNIGYMPESNPLYKEMLVSEALEYVLDIHQIFEEEKRLERINFVVKSTSLQQVFNKPINELSKGFKQRVGIAIALIHDPKILILDEPTEGLDPNQRSEIRELIKSIGENKTVIISTHVLAEVEAMCSRVIIINKGKVIADDSTQNILKYKDEKITVKFGFKLKNFDKNSFSKTFSEYEINILQNSDSYIEVDLISKNESSLMEDITKYIRNNESLVLFSLSKQILTLEEIFKNLTKSI